MPSGIDVGAKYDVQECTREAAGVYFIRGGKRAINVENHQVHTDGFYQPVTLCAKFHGKISPGHVALRRIFQRQPKNRRDRVARAA